MSSDTTSLRYKVERMIGTAILKNDKNYTDDMMALFESELKKRENYSRMASLADLASWLKLHDITDINMVYDGIDHMTKSIQQVPDQRFADHPELMRSTLTKEKE